MCEYCSFEFEKDLQIKVGTDIETAWWGDLLIINLTLNPVPWCTLRNKIILYAHIYIGKLGFFLREIY